MATNNLQQTVSTAAKPDHSCAAHPHTHLVRLLVSHFIDQVMREGGRLNTNIIPLLAVPADTLPEWVSGQCPLTLAFLLWKPSPFPLVELTQEVRQVSLILNHLKYILFYNIVLM